MKKISVFLLFALSYLTIQAQHSKPSFSFAKETHDFGTLKEEDGNVSYKFEFTNIGGQPMVIHNVIASCGCTTPDWTRMPIPPGGKGYVSVAYNPKNRPGPFNKTITVSSNAEQSSKVLRITGKVTPKPLTIEELYPREIDGLRLKAGHLSFTRVTPGSLKTEELEVYNGSDENLSVAFKNVPVHITLKLEPSVIKTKEKGKIIATFDASKISDWGFVNTSIYLLVNNKSAIKKELNYNKRIVISATIEEDFSGLTAEELAKAPIADFDTRIFEFGTIKQDEEVKKSFVLTNKGKSNLIIRKVRAQCGCTAVTPQKSLLSPGESTEILTVFDSRGKSGRQNKSITIITNDPKNSTVLLRISGNVEVK
ncbi:MAG: DUF1573 domain-containing protein [Marinilabiliaceae bacterium]|nr:DUF1573 domain-containing protein [Marinilabiliaceae bacterium]